MPIYILCTAAQCGQRLEFTDDQAGRHASCLACGNEIRVPSSGEMIGRQLGEFHLLELLGKGAAGKVYRARQINADEQYAIKILNPDLSRDDTLIKRFEREARVTAQMNHPNIVRGHGIHRESFFVFLIMELITGENAKERLTRKGKLKLNETMKIALATVRALAHGQQHGLVHRDVKPANIIIDETGAIKLADFGMARDETDSCALTTAGVTMGTPLYTAPEQARDARMVDHRSDIYALGVTLLHLLTGKHPFKATAAANMQELHATERLPTGAELGTALPPVLDALLARMAAKQPSDRYQEHAALESDIEILIAS